MVPDTAEPAPRDLAGNGLKHLLAALGRLEPDRQRMILSAYFTGATRDRLGADVGCPVDLVKVQLRYALADLREYLGR
jgi:RNA polymerase sigma-70 factor (ECF subfamily)